VKALLEFSARLKMYFALSNKTTREGSVSVVALVTTEAVQLMGTSRDFKAEGKTGKEEEESRPFMPQKVPALTV
jgi:hypothetical protein